MRQWTVAFKHPTFWGKLKWFLLERCERAECDDIRFGPGGIAELSWTEQVDGGEPVSKCYFIWTENLLMWNCNYEYKTAVENVKKDYIKGMTEIANAQAAATNVNLWNLSTTKEDRGPEAQ